MTTKMRLILVLLPLITTPLVLQGAGTDAQISAADFFGDFEGAWLSNLKQLGPNYFSLEAQQRERFGYQGTLGIWVCAGIRLMEAKSRSRGAVRIVVPNGNGIAKLRAVYSRDRKTWMPVDVQRNSFDFDVPLQAGAKEVYFATFYPYFYSELMEHNRQLRRNRYARFVTIGKSVHGRDINLITITDSSATSKAKLRAFLIGGTHGAETASIYGVEGMLDFLTSEDLLAREMRQSVIWKVVPVLNVDATAEGLDRRNAGGVNLYMDWEGHRGWKPKTSAKQGPNPDPSIPTTDFTQPETRAAVNAIMAFRPNVFLDVHSWHFAGDGFWGPGPAVLDARSDDLKQHIAQHCKIEHWDHEDLVFTSAPTVIRRLKIAATLPEFALSYDSENRQKTPDSMRCQGIEILRGTFEYLKSIGQEGAN